MKRRTFLGLAAAIPWLAAPAIAASDGVIEAIEAVLAANGAGSLAGARAYLTGEAASWPAEGLGPMSKGPDFRVIRQTDWAVARVALLDNGQPAWDAYFYLRLDQGRWKVSAFRYLALSGMLFAARNAMRGKAQLSDEEADLLRNLELVLLSDAELRRWQASHRDILDAFRGMVAQAKPGDGTPLDEYLADLGFSSFEGGGAGPFMMTIGGVVDNTVGFLHPGEASPPTIDPSGYIWLEPVEGGWFLFKTT